MADETMGEDAVQPRESNGTEADENNEEETINEEEFEELNVQLDQLNTALDSLEKMNDGIHAELVELLKSNREAREEFQESRKEQSQELEKPNP